MFLYILRRINLLLITLLALTFVAYLLDVRLIGQQASFWSGYPDFLRSLTLFRGNSRNLLNYLLLLGAQQGPLRDLIC